MNIKTIFDRLLYYVSVPKCVLCNTRLDFEDKGICKACRCVYEMHKSRNCSRCAKQLHYCSCTNEYMKSHSIKKHLKLFKYLNTEQSQPGNHLIYSLKRDNRDDVIEFLSDELVKVIKYNIDVSNKENYILTGVPRRRPSIAKYGYDHIDVLARAVSKKLDIKYMKLLKSNSKKSQKQTRGIDRLTNANFDYLSKREINLKGKTAFIIDDIITTGASIGASAILVKGLGAKECIAVSCASAYNDQYTKRE